MPRMIALLQCVTRASVSVAGQIVGQIDAGLAVLAAIEPDDAEHEVTRMLDRLLAYRVFTDQAGKMNRSVTDIDGGLLLVPQFTLAADTRKGLRPSFTTAAPPAQANALFNMLVAHAQRCHPRVACGRFGTHMQVSLVNDGPATFILRI